MTRMKCCACLLGFFLILGLNAQAFWGHGDKKLQVGFTPYGYGTGLTGVFDYGLSSWASVGLGVEKYFSGERSTFLYVFGRANAHLGRVLDLPKKWDVYPGISLGVLGDNRFGIGGHLGARYFFTRGLGAYIELGSRGSLGLSIDL